MDKVREFRQRAKECLESAAEAPNAKVRSRYEELARIWKKLADERLHFFVQSEAAEPRTGVEQ